MIGFDDYPHNKDTLIEVLTWLLVYSNGPKPGKILRKFDVTSPSLPAQQPDGSLSHETDDFYTEEMMAYEWLSENEIIYYQRIIKSMVNPDELFGSFIYEIKILNEQQLNNLLDGAIAYKGEVLKRKPAKITYDVRTGYGTSNTEEFSVNGKNKLIFDKLVSLGSKQWLQRAELWKLMGNKKAELENKQTTIEINNFITHLRSLLHLNPYQLILRNGDIYLNANITDEVRLFLSKKYPKNT